MKKKICMVLCLLSILLISTFVGIYSSKLIPISIDIYQTIFDKKNVRLGPFVIKVPHGWIIAKEYPKDKEIVTSNVPRLLTNYNPCFITIKVIDIDDNRKYDMFASTSNLVGGFYCKIREDRNSTQCISSNTHGKAIFFYMKNCEKNNIDSFLNKVQISVFK